jgi:hypothetical protein
MQERRHGHNSTRSRPLRKGGADASLLDIVDHVLTKGVVVAGDLVLGVADIDFIYLRLSAVLCSADRIFGASPGSAKHRALEAGAARLRRRRP